MSPSTLSCARAGSGAGHCEHVGVDWSMGTGRLHQGPGEVRGISFSADVKNEMAGHLPARPCCQLSELLGIYFGSRGRLIKKQSEGPVAYFSLLRNPVARKVVRLGRAPGP